MRGAHYRSDSSRAYIIATVPVSEAIPMLLPEIMDIISHIGRGDIMTNQYTPEREES